MAGRRGWGEDSIYFDHSGECRDPDNHRHCPGRWRGVVSLKSGPDGKRRRKKVSGRNKTEVRAKLAELHDELSDGVVSEAGYTVAQAIRDYLADGLPGRAPKTIRTQREVLEPLLPILGNVPLRELTAADVRSALIKLAITRATRTVSMTHAALARAIRHAEAGDKVRRNVAALVDSPSGRQGRPSRSLTFEQAVALITAAREYNLYAYVVLSLLVGLRTEEARALRWDHVQIGVNWTPRELRHTFVSLLSGNGMAIEDISHLVGHSSTLVTQTVYRHELRPVVTSGAEMMDRIFADGAK